MGVLLEADGDELGPPGQSVKVCTEGDAPKCILRIVELEDFESTFVFFVLSVPCGHTTQNHVKRGDCDHLSVLGGVGLV